MITKLELQNENLKLKLEVCDREILLKNIMMMKMMIIIINN